MRPGEVVAIEDVHVEEVPAPFLAIQTSDDAQPGPDGTRHEVVDDSADTKRGFDVFEGRRDQLMAGDFGKPQHERCRGRGGKGGPIRLRRVLLTNNELADRRKVHGHHSPSPVDSASAPGSAERARSPAPCSVLNRALESAASGAAKQ